MAFMIVVSLVGHGNYDHSLIDNHYQNCECGLISDYKCPVHHQAGEHYTMSGQFLGSHA